MCCYCDFYCLAQQCFTDMAEGSLFKTDKYLCFWHQQWSLINFLDYFNIFVKSEKKVVWFIYGANIFIILLIFSGRFNHMYYSTFSGVFNTLTQCGPVATYGILVLGQHWFGYGLVPSLPYPILTSHKSYPHTIQLNLIRNSTIPIQENAFGIVIWRMWAILFWP